MEHFSKTPKITRFSPPGDLDQLPYGTICEVIESGIHTLYIQKSPDEEHPKWAIIEEKA